tara:strand:+ start:11082 stop:11435 length:354 start_codon:yes stop_codon:yes gene_type:complete
MNESTDNHNENDYIIMANHCKELVEQKDKIIEFYKSRLNEMDDELRSMAYLTSNIIYIIKYKIAENVATCKKKGDDTFLDLLHGDISKMKNFIDTLRDMTEVDEFQEELIINQINIG